MQYDPFECFVCLRGYNLAECLPRMLPHCGHTICCQCLEELLKSTRPKCPLDNKEFSPHDQTSHGQATVEDFPINFALRNFLEENSKWEVCKIHQKKVELVCLSDKSCLCAYCALFNGHQGHDVKPMEEIKTSLGEDVGKLEIILNDLDSYYREVDFGLETEKKNLLKVINDQFSGLISIVNKKRLEITNEVQLFFKQEQTKLTAVFGGDSEIRSEILRKLDGCRGFTNYDIVTKVQEVAEISEMLNKCQTIRQEQEGVCKQKQEDMIVILNEFLDAQNYIETQLKESSEKLLNDLYSLREGTLQRTEQCIRDYGAAECFEVESCIQIDTSNEYLEILATNKIPEKLIVDPQEWRDAREVRLTLHKFAFEKRDVDILRFIWSQFDTIHSIRIFAEHQDNIKESDLDNLFNLIFSNLHELQQIRLDISWSKIGSRSITWLTENVLSKASKLKHLNFKLYGTDVNDEAIKALAESFPHYTHGLESFSINLGVTAVTEQAVTHLFKGMPAVKIFKLGLSETKASDQCLQAFAEGMLQTMVSLEVLQLYLRDTEITDEGILRLIGCLPDVKRLQLSLETTKVTDKSIEKLLENKLGKMKSLKNLYLNLKDSQVSQKMITQVDQVQKKYSM